LWASYSPLKISAEGGVIRYGWGQVDTVTRWNLTAGWSLSPRWLWRTEISRTGIYREAATSLNYFL
jgi:hypothetical protein